MSTKSKKAIKGFTLIEMVLVLVIISMVIYSTVGYLQQRTSQLRVNRTAAQIQQIENAALAYFVANGRWPADFSGLQDGNYLPTAAQVPLINPWGKAYHGVPYSSTTGVPASFYVYTEIPGTVSSGRSTATAVANTIIPSLAMGYTSSNSTTPITGSACNNSTTSCFVVSMVNVPGQNLNNANAVTFAGLYHHGGCVPVPQCPMSPAGLTMTPQIMVVPVSVSGLNDTITSGINPNVYPISSFTAYAKSNVAGGTPTNTTPPLCDGSDYIRPTNSTQCPNETTSAAASAYWRVCLDITTEKGKVSDNNQADADTWGKYVTVMAITRCAITNEPAGSTFNVYSN